ncbi:hypothetical protein FIBSPDRAFT_943296 [Athelia psychrophila]|uniref:ATP-grasp domain-containing protein n=1 Tax=Athelia psychrophila TaxID=1759441 RepID=A0A166W8Q6_9AGAM|nr:hypothetical protein FIBSPDRAFT_943296 [Fibularhizoctonia sp. CBS 109695]
MTPYIHFVWAWEVPATPQHHQAAISALDLSHGAVTQSTLADRGEIAIHILRIAGELGWSTAAFYTAQDASEATVADEAVKLDDPSWFIRPGYASRSPQPSLPTHLDDQMTHSLALPRKLCIAGDKMLSNLQRIYMRLLSGIRYPVMIKTLDGGGGRGIRVGSAQGRGGVQTTHMRHPVRPVSFREGAVWTGMKAQRSSDCQQWYGRRGPEYIWQRERSVQRRFQKLVETAPSTVTRHLVQLSLAGSTTMARALRHQGVGIVAYLGAECISIRGSAVRVCECNMGTDLDSLLAEILVCGRDLGEVTQQAARALRETSVGNEEGEGKTNIGLHFWDRRHPTSVALIYKDAPFPIPLTAAMLVL